MNKRVFFYLLFIVFLSSVACKNNNAAKRKYIMPEDSIVMILNDLYVLSGINTVIDDSVLYKNDLYKSYFKKNNIDMLRFDTSLQYYYDCEPKKLTEEIYKEVIDSLTYIKNHL